MHHLPERVDSGLKCPSHCCPKLFTSVLNYKHLILNLLHLTLHLWDDRCPKREQATNLSRFTRKSLFITTISQWLRLPNYVLAEILIALLTMSCFIHCIQFTCEHLFTQGSQLWILPRIIDLHLSVLISLILQRDCWLEHCLMVSLCPLRLLLIYQAYQ